MSHVNTVLGSATPIVVDPDAGILRFGAFTTTPLPVDQQPFVIANIAVTANGTTGETLLGFRVGGAGDTFVVERASDNLLAETDDYTGAWIEVVP